MAHRHYPSLWQDVLHLLAAAPDGVRPIECWRLLQRQPVYRTLSYHTVFVTMQRLCARGFVIGVASRRYALSAAFRQAFTPIP